MVVPYNLLYVLCNSSLIGRRGGHVLVSQCEGWAGGQCEGWAGGQCEGWAGGQCEGWDQCAPGENSQGRWRHYQTRSLPIAVLSSVQLGLRLHHGL